MSDPRIVAVVPARDEVDRIADTVRALRDVPEIDEVVVVADGSRDATAAVAWSAGARVLSSRRRLGKGRAVDRALDRITADIVVLADGDLGSSARALVPLLAEVACDRADVAIAVLPPQGGGFGLVKRASRSAIRRLSGYDAEEPLSGQRVMTRQALTVCRPFARGFGLETAMTIDAARAGLRIVEASAELHHRPTGRDARGFLHRGRQGVDILRAVVPRMIRRRARRAARMNWGRLSVANHRGAPVPRILGVPLILAALGGTLVAAIGWDAGGVAWIVCGASAVVFAAGLVDDLVVAGPRGIRQHLRALIRMDVSSGIVKVLLICGAAVAAVASLPFRPDWIAAASAIAIAASANLWNGLDVVPGRALKWFLVVGVPVSIGGFLTAGGWIDAPAVPATVLAAALVLALDLRERAMLGDAGANLLGFEIGVGLCVVLSDAWIVAAAVLAVALNAVAETLTLSRVIERSAPLRWFDRLGRVRDAGERSPDAGARKSAD
ncbi:MAG: glycosyltransferase [Actinomycetota bacterium]